MLKTRIITGIILLVLFAADLFLASFQVFALVLGFVVAASAWEWSRLCKVQNQHMQTAFAAFLGLLTIMVLYIPYSEALTHWILLIGVVYWIIVPISFYMLPKLQVFDQMQTGLLLQGVVVMLIAALAIQYLRSYLSLIHI